MLFVVGIVVDFQGKMFIKLSKFSHLVPIKVMSTERKKNMNHSIKFVIISSIKIQTKWRR